MGPEINFIPNMFVGISRDGRIKGDNSHFSWEDGKGGKCVNSKTWEKTRNFENIFVTCFHLWFSAKVK